MDKQSDGTSLNVPFMGHLKGRLDFGNGGWATVTLLNTEQHVTEDLACERHSAGCQGSEEALSSVAVSSVARPRETLGPRAGTVASPHPGCAVTGLESMPVRAAVSPHCCCCHMVAANYQTGEESNHWRCRRLDVIFKKYCEP